METEDDEQSDLIEILYQLSDILLISKDPKEHISGQHGYNGFRSQLD